MSSQKNKKTDLSIFAPTKEIIGRLSEHSHYARGTKAFNTTRGQRADYRIYSDWCDENSQWMQLNGYNPIPAHPKQIVKFIDDQSETKSVATVNRYLSSLKVLHRIINPKGEENPCSAEIVRLAVRRMRRAKGSHQKQVKGINFNLRNQMLGACDKTTLIGKRNSALLAVGYDTLLRRSELVSLKIEDLNFDDDGQATVLVRKSKTDQTGKGVVKNLYVDTVRILAEWLDAYGQSSGYIFPSFKRRRYEEINYGSQLSDQSVPKIYKKMATSAGFDYETVDCIAGHSTRVGPAQDMTEYDIETTAILQAGGWSSPEMIIRYTRNLDAKKSGSARLARKQNRI